MSFTQGKAYLKGDERRFAKDMEAVVDYPMLELARDEAISLTALFQSMSAVLLPYAFNDNERSVLTPDGLSKLYQDCANGYDVAVFSKPIVKAEGVAFVPHYVRDARAYAFHLNPTKEFDTAARNYDIKCAVLNPSMTHNKGRLFNLGRFEFLNVAKKINHEQSLIFPLISLPSQYLNSLNTYECLDLLDTYIELSWVINHDPLHSIMANNLKPNIVNAPKTSYMGRNPNYLTRFAKDCEKLNKGTRSSPLTRQSKIVSSATDYFESFNMRVQAEILQHMVEQEGNPLTAAIDHYVGAWKKFARASKKAPHNQDLNATPADFALKLLAFNLVRALPIEHDVIQGILNDPEIAPHRAAFEEVYRAKITGVVFGNGQYNENFGTPIVTDGYVERGRFKGRLTSEQYGSAVCDMVASALGTISEDVAEMTR